MLVKRANVILKIKDDEKLAKSYISRGFSVIDEKGNVIKEGLPTDITSLRVAYIKSKKMLDEKDKQIMDLTNEIKLLTAQLKAAKKKQAKE